MKKLPIEIIEGLTVKFRIKAGMSQTEPFNPAIALRGLGVIAVYRPLSNESCGLSLRTPDARYRFMLINSESSLGRQNFTIAHELFHLYFDDSPEPHLLTLHDESRNPAELNANSFASSLLLPRDGVLMQLPTVELTTGQISVSTMLRIEQTYGVSHQSMAYRLRHLRLINEEELERQLAVKIQEEARLLGYDLAVYRKGGIRPMIGDMGEKAKKLLDKGEITQEYYRELAEMVRV